MKVELTSDITGQKYTGDSYESALESLKKAEEEFTENKLKEEEKTKALSVEKKALCKEIDECKNEISKAREARRTLENQIQKEFDEFYKKNSEALEQARKVEYDARKEYINKLNEYEKKYNRGYTKILTGKEAEKEINDFINEFNSIWNSFFKFRF